MIHTWSVRISEYIGKELNIDQNKIAIVSYGLEVIIGAVIKLAFFILVPWKLGVLKEFMIAYLSFAFLRVMAGGIHCSAFYRCLLISVAAYLGIALLAISLDSFPLPYRELYWVVLALALLIVVVRAPVDVTEKPIICPRRRLLLKIISCLVITIYFLLSILWEPRNVVYIASGLAILFQVFTLTESGGKIFKLVDQII